MTNFEKYKDEIQRVITESGNTSAMKDRAVVACKGLRCAECDFREGSCAWNRINWLLKDDGEEHDACKDCKYEYKNADESPCTECCNNYTSKWERRPKKTRQDEFLEHYPDAKKDVSGILAITPCSLGERKHQYCNDGTCWECKRDYWSQEVE